MIRRLGATRRNARGLSIHPSSQPARLPNDMTMRRKMEERMDKGPTDFVIAYKCNLFRNCNNADVD